MREIDNLIICEHLGYCTPTVVWHKGECMITEKLSLSDTVKAWREKWIEFWGGAEWIVLALDDKQYQALHQRPLSSNLSVRELLYEQKVICINTKEIEKMSRRGGQ